MSEPRRFEVMFRGGPMDGLRSMRGTLPAFLDFPKIAPTTPGGYVIARYRRAETVIPGPLTIYELATVAI
jgi:hypothetical protein